MNVRQKVFSERKRESPGGDNVEIEVLDEKDREGNITEILPRKNELVRPAAANVDQALVVFAVAKPDPHFHLLDRFLVMMERKEIPVILCFNKDDLGTEEKIGELAGYLPGLRMHAGVCQRRHAAQYRGDPRTACREDYGDRRAFRSGKVNTYQSSAAGGQYGDRIYQHKNLNGESILRDIRNYSHWEIIRTLWIRQGSVPCTWKILKRKI